MPPSGWMDLIDPQHGPARKHQLPQPRLHGLRPRWWTRRPRRDPPAEAPPPQTWRPAGCARSAAARLWCDAPLPACGKTRPWRDRCHQSHAATPRAGSLLKQFASFTLTPLNSGTRFFRQGKDQPLTQCRQPVRPRPAPRARPFRHSLRKSTPQGKARRCHLNFKGKRVRSQRQADASPGALWKAQPQQEIRPPHRRQAGVDEPPVAFPNFSHAPHSRVWNHQKDTAMD